VRELEKVSHRSYTTGFFYPKNDHEKVSYNGYIKSFRFIAYITKIEAPGIYALKVFNGFHSKQDLEVIGPEMKNNFLAQGSYELLDSDKKPSSSLKHRFDGFLKTTADLKVMDIIRLKTTSF
jgi:hypothetical protein